VTRAFDFHLSRCDRVVAGVLRKIGVAAATPPETLNIPRK
jgi:hypothetical protein